MSDIRVECYAGIERTSGLCVLFCAGGRSRLPSLMGGGIRPMRAIFGFARKTEITTFCAMMKYRICGRWTAFERCGNGRTDRP
jgi:hypothetical protein